MLAGSPGSPGSIGRAQPFSTAHPTELGESRAVLPAQPLARDGSGSTQSSGYRGRVTGNATASKSNRDPKQHEGLMLACASPYPST